jgi:hypothetical protein
MDVYDQLTSTVRDAELPVYTKLQAICSAITSTIDPCNRVSIWLFNESKDEIFCIICKDDESGYSIGQHLSKEEVVPYFEAILEHNVVSAADARHHPSTACFNENYFFSNNIFSLLDYVFYRNGEPAGIMCCERVGDMAHWQESDVEALKRSSEIASLFFSQDIMYSGAGKEQIVAACQQQPKSTN